MTDCFTLTDGSQWYHRAMTSKQLQAFRQQHNLTQQTLAGLLGVHRNTVNRWEMGIREIPIMVEKLLECLVMQKKILRRAGSE